jgi:pimeloyl-ACP methyl ester carboxylesterase
MTLTGPAVPDLTGPTAGAGTTPRELQLEVPGLELAARAWGPEDAPGVLALHGWLDNAASFDRLAPLLGQTLVVALDLPGHGRSQHLPPGATYHFIDWIPHVLAAARALGWERFSLLGHSMGAGIASMIPASAPGTIERLVLLEGAGPMVAEAEQAPAQLVQALEDERQGAGAAPRTFRDLTTATRARMAGGADLDAASTRLLVERGTTRTPEGLCFRHDPRLKGRSRLRLTEAHALAFLAGIDCPTLAIRARSGWPFSVEQLRRRLSVIPRLETLEVDGGHHVHLTHPERVAPAIRSFLAAAGS